MIESILGIDPSLTNTGLCILSLHEPFVVFDRIHFDESIGRDWSSTYSRIKTISYNISYFLDLYKPDLVSMEQPLPVGQYVGGLAPLGLEVINSIFEKYSSLFLFHPTYIGYILSKKSYKISEVVDLVKQIIVKERMVPSVTRFSGDEAVAFLFAYRLRMLCGKVNLSGNSRFEAKKETWLSRGEKECRKYLQRQKTM